MCLFQMWFFFSRFGHNFLPGRFKLSSFWGSFLSAPLLWRVFLLHVGERPGGSGVRPEPEVSPVVELSSLEGKATVLCTYHDMVFKCFLWHNKVLHFLFYGVSGTKILIPKIILIILTWPRIIIRLTAASNNSVDEFFYEAYGVKKIRCGPFTAKSMKS